MTERAARRPSVRQSQLRQLETPAVLGPVTDLHTERLTLHPVDTAEAERIVARQRGPEDSWARDFPFDGDVIGVTAFLRAVAANGDQRPFGHYRITRTADGQAIGGIGFKGQPVNGSVEIGYGLVPSARGNGYAAEAAQAFVALARQQGLSCIVADTDEDNIASQRTLERVGFTQTGTNGDLCRYTIVLVA
jgi:RimJ/RimL family protein N-acetyltransferase